MKKSTQTLLGTLAVIFAMGTSNAAFAAKMKNIKTMTSPALEKIAATYDYIVGGIDDTGVTKVSILEKKTTEKWEQTIKQMYRRNRYINEADALIMRKSASTIKKSFQSLIDGGGYLSHEDEAIAELNKKVLPLILKAAAQSTIKFYNAGFSGEFDAAYGSFVFVDTDNNEILSLDAGYSE